MKLLDIIRPLSVDEFRDRFFGRQCVLIKRKRNHLESLLSLAEIEARLNDGVGTQHSLAVIGADGRKLPPAEVHVKQTGQAWSSSFVAKHKVKALLSDGCSFVLHNMSAATPRVESLIREVESLGDRVQADAHVYVSPKAGATGYQVHKDEPQHKLYIQLYGSTEWVVYKGQDSRRSMSTQEAESKLTVDFAATLTAGSVLYMPPGVFHRACNPHGPRVSLSIPFYESPQSTPVDREPLDLVSLFPTTGPTG